jgi:nitrite reductase/ring-hydroxylating ferredoxin subunit
MSDSMFREVCQESDLVPGRFRRIEIDGRAIVVYRLGDGWYATDNACPHRGGPLAEGDLIGNEIVCPWHLWSFDVRTGLNPGSPEGREIRVCTHDVKVEDGVVFVSLSADEPEVA